MSLVYVIEDDPTMAEVIGLAARQTKVVDESGKEQPPRVRVFNDAVEPLKESAKELPDVILLDVLLSGPDGFAFLNELISYTDTAKVPVALMTSMTIPGRDLRH